MRPAKALILALIAVVTLGVTACSSGDPDTARARIEDGATLIDVRTPQEYDEGHLEGAINIDVQAADFDERVQELPRDEPYVVYCRSGSRSAQAISRMEELGFTDLTNGGAYDDLR
jgi:rhodanese-related sulfurtransferase